MLEKDFTSKVVATLTFDSKEVVKLGSCSERGSSVWLVIQVCFFLLDTEARSRSVVKGERGQTASARDRRGVGGGQS